MCLCGFFFLSVHKPKKKKKNDRKKKTKKPYEFKKKKKRKKKPPTQNIGRPSFFLGGKHSIAWVAVEGSLSPPLFWAYLFASSFTYQVDRREKKKKHWWGRRVGGRKDHEEFLEGRCAQQVFWVKSKMIGHKRMCKLKSKDLIRWYISWYIISSRSAYRLMGNISHTDNPDNLQYTKTRHRNIARTEIQHNGRLLRLSYIYPMICPG